MDEAKLHAQVSAHLTELAVYIGSRPTGSEGNHRAGEYIQQVLTEFGWEVETQRFECLTWQAGEAHLTGPGPVFALTPNPFSMAFEGEASLVLLRTLADLESVGDLSGQIAVLTAELSQYSYMPKNFPFFRSDDQQRVIHLLETKQPAAVLGYLKSPLFCDADFLLPSATIAPEFAEVVQYLDGQTVHLSISGRTIPTDGYNVVARSREMDGPKIILCAHYDTWFDTPGALDNGSGVAALLTLAGVLDQETYPLELVFFNGEDHYAAPGQVAYLSDFYPDEAAYVINIDGIGAVGKHNSLALFGDDPFLFDAAYRVQEQFPNLEEVPAWYESDHTMFVQQGLPALAFSSANAYDLWNVVTHTHRDRFEQVDIEKVVEVVQFIEALFAAVG
ncbi:MAG: M28 family peptidase [Anaerolineae bacterium]|nr:M28 family peptidase [Anaerolineae bacterium]